MMTGSTKRIAKLCAKKHPLFLISAESKKCKLQMPKAKSKSNMITMTATMMIRRVDTPTIHVLILIKE